MRYNNQESNEDTNKSNCKVKIIQNKYLIITNVLWALVFIIERLIDH